MITHKAYLYDKYLKNSISVIKFIISLNDKRYIKLMLLSSELSILNFSHKIKTFFWSLSHWITNYYSVEKAYASRKKDEIITSWIKIGLLLRIFPKLNLNRLSKKEKVKRIVLMNILKFILKSLNNFL